MADHSDSKAKGTLLGREETTQAESLCFQPDHRGTQAEPAEVAPHLPPSDSIFCSCFLKKQSPSFLRLLTEEKFQREETQLAGHFTHRKAWSLNN